MPCLFLPRILLLRAFAMSMVLVGWNFGPKPGHAGSGCRPWRFDILTPGLAGTPYIVLTAGG